MTTASILVVDDDRDVRTSLARALRRVGYAVWTAADGYAALRVTAHLEINLVIADLRMPDLDGLALVRALRRRGPGDIVPIILMSGYDDRPARIWGFDLGADDFLPKPIATDELLAHVRAHLRRSRTARRLRRESTTDDLTSVLNRRGIVQAIERETARRTAVGTYVLVLDVDDFKAINDRHGHAAGDAALVAVASFVRERVRACDSVGRLGGDEFVVVMPDADDAAARSLADRLRAPLELRLGQASLPMTLSVGIAEALPDEAPHLALERADRRMYGEKHNRSRQRSH